MHLVQLSAEHREEARNLQREIHDFRVQLQKALDEVWPAKNDSGEIGAEAGINSSAGATSWAERMEERKRERKSAVERIAKPEITTSEDTWRVQVLEI